VCIGGCCADKRELTERVQDNMQAKLPDLRIAIIGGGVGGLAAAVALKQAGFKSVTIYEQSRFIQEVGAGIQVCRVVCWRVGV
jgi:NADPH-dependent 2,4-dienoyl-CoA reductase/sulfur reductase-like enzyme